MSKSAQKVLLKGNEIMSEAAIQAGCRFFAGYPITPQNEVPEYMSWRMPESGGTFIQAESELASINMLYGASAAGARCMTSTSSPGFSLKLEGISYMAGAELPCVLANMQRGGPGLGNISGAQSDYFQAVKGGGHGDYRLIVLAPSTLSELYELTMNAFDYADLYRNPTLILGDGILGQMTEPVELRPYKPIVELPEKDFVLDGCKDREPRIIKSLRLIPADSLAIHNKHLKEKYQRITDELKLSEQIQTDDAELVIAAYGTTARIAKGAIEMARKEGMKVGMVRPITLWPFPDEAFKRAAKTAKNFLTVEMSNGQLIEDVRLAIECERQVDFFGVGGGWYPTPEEIFEAIKKVYK